MEKFAAMVNENGGEDFEYEDDLLDWRFAKETLEDLMRQKKEIEDAKCPKSPSVGAWPGTRQFNRRTNSF
ncbi:hypothetical protein [Neomoorella humiferrea]|uniref:hypothetical protein n=1 Tax=Neomoorella humiferrea TaxID=676965 RepID=UPI0030D1AEB1